MDNITLDAMARDCCPALWTKFGGVWSADNFHLGISSGGNRNNHPNLCDSMIFQFQIVNSARSNDVGRHWILLIVAAVPMKTTKNIDRYPRQQQQGFVGYKYIKHKSVVLVWDCMGMPIRQYTHFFKRLKFLFFAVDTNAGGFSNWLTHSNSNLKLVRFALSLYGPLFH